MKYSSNFFRDKDGIISIEFAACFCLFSVFVFMFYDAYSSIMLQGRLERANYAVATVFRERSALYPAMDDTNTRKDLLCRHSNSCFKSRELFDRDQMQELSKLASSLLDREVTVKVDGLFILQDVNNPASLEHAQFQVVSSTSCSYGICDRGIKNYFESQPPMTDKSESARYNFSKLTPYVKRFPDFKSGLDGRWIPLYRVSMCINNDESLYLKWINTDRKATGTLPILCSSTVVLSRCNDIANDANTGCPLYYR
ncbi:tight adherence pilus pseudopilin TadF [Gilliamella mensalis]|uniref:tight adherence pilus pseudopilin TadF n=1 Tax=Gilliamella mensalis TaxID=1908520 RepID=UPI000A169E48|nr:tight adherence pilus pseudopilin TadF [Gilliamella mensalis]